MTKSIAISVAGATLAADPAGALFWAEQSLLVVSDLHLEKGSFYAARGVHLPPYDSRTTLGRLAVLTDRYKPARVIALGDSFHDRAAAERLCEADCQAICRLTEACDWIWIIGNHDPEPPTAFGGRIEETVRLGPLTFRHEPRIGETAEIAGHLHPCASLRMRGRTLRRRCFVCDGTRLIMPAFGAYTGGLDVFDPAYDGLFTDGFRAWLLGRTGVYPVAHTKLLSGVETENRAMTL